MASYSNERVTTPEKCEVILRTITEQTRKEDGGRDGKEPFFSLGWDFDTWSLTVEFPDGSHTHVGVPDGTFEVMVDQLYDAIVLHRGLSRVKGGSNDD